MKKIYLMAVTAAFAMSVNAQTTVKLKNPSFRGERKASTSKVASPSQVACVVACNTQYVAGSTMNLQFSYTASNTDLEFVDYFELTFPAGITPNSSTDATFPTSNSGGGAEALNPVAGQVISWGVDNNDQYGGIITTATGVTFNVNVTIGAGVTGNQTASYLASGDGYGTTPGDATGTAIIYPAGATVVDMKTKFVVPTTITAINNCNMGMDQIGARFINSSSTAQSNIPVNYSVNGVAATATVIAGPIAVGDSIDLLFTTPYNFGSSNMYTIKAWAHQAADVAMGNDTASLVISNTIPTALTNTATPYVNGIETAYDFGSINKTWVGTGLAFGLSTGTIHSGTSALFYTIASGAPTNTYVAFNVLPCVDVTAGEIYKISFWKKANTSGTLTVNGQYGVATGLAQDAASMTTVLKPNTAIVPNAQTGPWTKDSVNFSATVTETRYFALIGAGSIVNPSDQINVRFDDIMISKINTVGIKTNSSNEAISIFPNPTSGILNINAIEVNSSIEVYNVVGDKVYTSSLVKGNNSIDLSGLANGAYFVKLNSNNQIITKKVVLSK